MLRRLFFARLSCAFVVAAAACSLAAAQEFRVDTEVFVNQEKKPILEQLTIFTADGPIYDFALTEPKEVTVFDPRRGVFTVLHDSRRVKAVVKTQELLDFALDLETHAAQSKSALFAFCAVPKFETTAKDLDRDGQTLIELRLVGKPLTYVAQGEQPKRDGAAKAYRSFADWCARLNSTVPGNFPAPARLALNQELAERDLLPLEITRISSPSAFKKIEHRSQHRFNWILGAEDHKKIEHAADMIATFQVVAYTDYLELKGKPVAEKQVAR